MSYVSPHIRHMTILRSASSTGWDCESLKVEDGGAHAWRSGVEEGALKLSRHLLPLLDKNLSRLPPNIPDGAHSPLVLLQAQLIRAKVHQLLGRSQLGGSRPLDVRLERRASVRLERLIVDELRLLHHVHAAFGPLLQRTASLSPKQEVVIVHHAASKIAGAENGGVVEVEVVRARPDEAVAQARLAHAALAFLLLRAGQPNDDQVVDGCSHILLFGHHHRWHRLILPCWPVALGPLRTAPPEPSEPPRGGEAAGCRALRQTGSPFTPRPGARARRACPATHRRLEARGGPGLRQRPPTLKH
ncbi:hypothetical protein EYF80_034974 [Liparis tanakae]|uniref:Uncharacterized protein n=1 Tax=Liparis tanakae TaxID=230148 RepID=A0A4Z2GNY0_9TELE|nr:hypothetical protein EYF80_034974 [Liparis tanakae]